MVLSEHVLVESFHVRCVSNIITLRTTCVEISIVALDFAVSKLSLDILLFFLCKKFDFG